MQENEEKSKQKEGKKNHTKQCRHDKYEICLMEMI